MMVMGDSLAENLFHGLDRRAEATGEPLPERADLIFLGCSLAKAPEGSLNRWADEDRPVCRTDYDAVTAALDTYDVDVMVLPMGPPDLLPRKYPNDPEFVLTDDPAFYDRLEGVYLELQAIGLDAGVSVLWVNTPCVSDERSENVGVTHQAIRSGNSTLDEIGDDSPPWVDVFDLYGEVCPDDVFDVSYEVDGVADENAREDGLHFSDFSANALSVQIANAARALPSVPVP